MQCGGDAANEWIEKTFPESIARDSEGHLYPTWIDCCFANGDPSTPFGHYIEQQLQQVLNVYPELDGIFVDQLCYQAFDYAHQDGLSAKNGCAVYEYGASLEKQFRKFAKALHDKNKLVLVNGAFDLECSLSADAIMSEGSDTIFATYRYLCIRRPMLIHEFPDNAFKAECMLRSALLTAAGWSLGGSPSTAYAKKVSSEAKKLYQQYLPLLEKLFGAEILLEENPLDWEPKPLAAAEIFRSRKDRRKIYVSVLQNTGSLHSEIVIKIKVKNKNIQKLCCMTVKDPEWRQLAFQIEDAWLKLVLPNNFSAALIELQGSID
ncbi:hypothetical protein SDC9_113940 [bioreactor metagenome]|uniref:Uncharacterized protein n=1 Tax=bioreactor metagenome TaxID=1076179 RepID=A0A645BZ85_9ZZZZ